MHLSSYRGRQTQQWALGDTGPSPETLVTMVTMLMMAGMVGRLLVLTSGDQSCVVTPDTAAALQCALSGMKLSLSGFVKSPLLRGK